MFKVLKAHFFLQFGNYTASMVWIFTENESKQKTKIIFTVGTKKKNIKDNLKKNMDGKT